MHKYLTFFYLQYVLFLICVLTILENVEIIHLPFLRYTLSLFFVYIFLYLLLYQKSTKVNYPIIVFFLIIIYIISFFRGIDADDLTIKKYFSSVYSFYFFPLLILIKIDNSILKFLKLSVYFSLIISIVVILTLPFWLNSQFYTDQISRILFSFSAISLLFVLPYYKRFNFIILFNFFISIILNIYMARRAESFFFTGIILCVFLIGSKKKPIKYLFYIIILFFFFFLVNSYYGLGNNLLVRFDEGYENRSFLFEEVLINLKETNSFLFGKGCQATYYSDVFGKDRIIVEHGYYDLLLRSGIFFVLLFLCISIIAAYRGLFKSKNVFSKSLGLYIILYIILMFGHGVFEFSYRVFFLWLAISICLSDNLLRLNDKDLAKHF